MEKEKFARFAAHQINAEAVDDGCDRLVVVAPSHIPDEFRAALDVATEAKIIGTLLKDLVETLDSELWLHIQSCVPRVIAS